MTVKITKKEELECARHIVDSMKAIFRDDSPESVLSDSELSSYYKALEVLNNYKQRTKRRGR